MSSERPQSFSRPLSDEARRRAFAAAAGVVVVATLGISLLPDSKPTARQPTAERAGPANIVGVGGTGATTAETTATAPASTASPATTTGSTPATATPMRDLTVADQRAVVARARAFLRAYLSYEIGAGDARVRRDLQRSATQALARQMLESAPHLPRAQRPAPGRVDSLELTDDPNSPVVAVAATIDRSGRLSSLVVQLDRQGHGWRVSSLH